MHLLLENAELLTEGNHHLIYLTRTNDNQAAVLKVLKPESHATEQLNQLRNEWEISHHVADTYSVRRALQKLKIGHQQALLFPYVEGVSIQELVEKRPPGLTLSLMLSLELTEAVHTLHQQNIVHRDITAHNLLVNEQTYEATLIDLGLATRLSVRAPYLGNPSQLQGSLQYMAPEQTGRIDRVIDERSDLYSLGIVLYQLFTGNLPFQALNALELIHQHLAVEPALAHTKNPELPPVVSNIIGKLLHKDPDKRYQTALGLKHDLEQCFTHWQQTSRLPNFELGKHDFSDKIVMPARLYGREKESKILQQALYQTKQGKAQVVWVEGDAGVGKTSLISSLSSSLYQYRALPAQAKFTSSPAEPYSALLTAFNQLIDLVLTESEENLVSWKISLREALGKEAGALIRLMPKLEYLLPNAPLPAQLEGTEAQARLTYLFNRFIQALGQPRHPLVLFLDDLQWADDASLAVINSLVDNRQLQHFLFIGAYRHQEVDEQHPLARMGPRNQGTHAGLPATLLHLSNLERDASEQLLADMLHLPVSSTRGLAQAIWDKTNGSPLFMQQFIKLLKDQGALRFNPQPSRHNPQPAHWQWDIFKLQKLKPIADLEELLSNRFQSLPAPVQQVLQLGAIVGNSFTAHQITLLTHSTPEQISTLLEPALVEGLVVSIHAAMNEEYSLSAYYQFSHDKVHQAMLDSLTEAECSRYNLVLSRALKQQPNFRTDVHQIYAAATHQNLALALIKEQGLQLEAMELNLQAAQLSLKALAYNQAKKFAQAAWQLGEQEGWPSNTYPVRCELASLLAEANFLTGNHEQVSGYTDYLLQDNCDVLTRARAYELRVRALIGLNQAKPAVATALQGLELFSIKLPAQPNKATILLDLLRTSWAIRGKRGEQLATLPSMTDAQALAAMRIMASIGSIISRVEPTMFPLLVGQLIRLSLRWGNSVESIPAYSGYGILQIVAFNRPAAAYEFGELALKLAHRLKVRQMLPKTYVVMASFLNFLKEPIRNGFNYLNQAYTTGLEVGDHEFAAYGLMVHGIHAFMAGDNLPELEEQLRVFDEKIGALNQKLPQLELSIFRQAIYAIQRGTDNGQQGFNGPFLSNEEANEVIRGKNPAARFYLNYCRLQISLYQRNISEAVNLIPALEQDLESVKASLFLPYYYYYAALALLQHYHQADAVQKKRCRRTVKKCLKHLAGLTKHAPANFQNKYYLVRAEWCRVNNKTKQACKAYSQAAYKAQLYDNLPEEALAYELMARFYIQSLPYLPASLYLQRAHDLYLQWGASGWAASLRKEFVGIYDKLAAISRSKSLEDTGRYLNADSLELSSILKASSALSRELKLDRLLATLLPIVIETAGAQQGYLLRPSPDRAWLVLAHTKDANPDGSLLLNEPLGNYPEIPESIVQYVSRTQQEVVLSDAGSDTRFQTDGAITKYKIKSVMCLPLMSQSNLTGMLYLENNLSDSAFTRAQLDILKVLSGQIAISLENALLYEKLENKIEERTLALEQQQLELEQKNRALIELNQEKDELVNIVAHDLRSPLNQIRGMANLIKLEKDRLSTDQQQYLTLISQSGERLGRMITNILNTSKAPDSKLQLYPEPIDANDLAQELIVHYKAGAQAKQIKLELERSSKPALALIDRNYCFQALENLVNNAIKFSPKQKTVLLRISVQVQNIRLEVQDQGPGISERDQKRLFSRFQTLSAQPTDGETSTGLGLSISKRFIESMGGKVGVNSQDGQGATFFALLPRYQAPSEKPQ